LGGCRPARLPRCEVRPLARAMQKVPQPGSADMQETSVSSKPGWRERAHRSAPESSGAGKYTEQAKQSISLQIPATHKQVTNQLLIYSPSLADRGLVGRYEPGQVGPANQSGPKPSQKRGKVQSRAIRHCHSSSIRPGNYTSSPSLQVLYSTKMSTDH